MKKEAIQQPMVDKIINLAEKINPQKLERWKAIGITCMQIAFAIIFTVPIALIYKAIAGASLSWVGISAVFLILTIGGRKIAEAVEAGSKYISFKAAVLIVRDHVEKTGKYPELAAELRKF